MDDTYNVGIVLSGGGARGIAHLGLIQAMEENGIGIDAISGTSAGAIIGALYANGYSPNEILTMIKSVSKYQLFSPAYSLKGLLKIEVLQKFIMKHITHDSFEELRIPLYVAATNLKDNRTDYFHSGELSTAVCASSCIPVLFNPLVWNDSVYIDGGILNNLPVEPLEGKTKVIIGLHSNPVPEGFVLKNARQVMERALMMAITCNVEARKGRCQHIIEPVGIGSYNVLDMKSAEEIFEIGYNAANEYFRLNQI